MDGQLEPDLWEALITAGACWRAAKAERRYRAEWEAHAMAFSEEAAILATHDVFAWRWPVTTGPGR